MPAESTYNIIQAITVSGSSTTSVTFSSIPQTYTDLVVIANTYNTTNAFLQYLVPVSSNGNYSGIIFRADGTTVTASRYTNDNVILADTPVGMNYQNSAYGLYEYYIPNYTNSAYQKIVLTRFSGDRAGAGITSFGAHSIRNTSNFTNITVSVGGGAFANGSTMCLYGIKAA